MNACDTYLSVDWPAPEHIGAVFTTRVGGISRKPYDSFNLATHVGDSATDVSANRAKLLRDRNIESICWLNQVHGVEVIEARAPGSTDPVPTADGSYTTLEGLACAIMVADCMPVMVTDTEGSCVGIAHAGWRGLCTGVIANLLSGMRISPEKALVWLGPCIGSDVFEVGPEVLEAFHSSPAFRSMPVSSAFQPGEGDRYFADLQQLARMQLKHMGIQAVYSHHECTYSHPQKYFSYRRDRESGRMAALIWIKGKWH